jgi:hypothetical protein
VRRVACRIVAKEDVGQGPWTLEPGDEPAPPRCRKHRIDDTRPERRLTRILGNFRPTFTAHLHEQPQFAQEMTNDGILLRASSGERRTGIIWKRCMRATSPLGAIGGCNYTILFVDDGSQDDSYRPGARDIDWIPADGRPLSPRQAFGRRDRSTPPRSRSSSARRHHRVLDAAAGAGDLARLWSRGEHEKQRNHRGTQENRKSGRAVRERWGKYI